MHVSDLSEAGTIARKHTTHVGCFVSGIRLKLQSKVARVEKRSRRLRNRWGCSVPTSCTHPQPANRHTPTQPHHFYQVRTGHYFHCRFQKRRETVLHTAHSRKSFRARNLERWCSYNFMDSNSGAELSSECGRAPKFESLPGKKVDGKKIRIFGAVLYGIQYHS